MDNEYLLYFPWGSWPSHSFLSPLSFVLVSGFTAQSHAGRSCIHIDAAALHWENAAIVSMVSMGRAVIWPHRDIEEQACLKAPLLKLGLQCRSLLMKRSHSEVWNPHPPAIPHCQVSSTTGRSNGLKHTIFRWGWQRVGFLSALCCNTPEISFYLLHRAIKDRSFLFLADNSVFRQKMHVTGNNVRQRYAITSMEAHWDQRCRS